MSVNRRRSLLVLPMAVVSAPVFAQVAPDTEADPDKTIIVTAARTELQFNALPMTIDVLDNETLTQQIAIGGSVVDAVSALTPSFSPTRQKLSGAGETLSGPFAQAWSEGALRMSRGEGIWYSYGKMFIVDTSTGVDSRGRRGRGYGTVWVLDLATQRLSALFVSSDQAAAHNPDNITVSPRGGVVLCEDPDAAPSGSPDVYGPGTRLVGLSRRGEPFYLVKNNAELAAAQIAGADKTVTEGDYRDSEFCGACWSPDGRTLFVNLQSPGITFAITGPWQTGAL